MSQYGRSRSLRVPINVSLSTATRAKNITREIGDVSFRHSIPGGFESITCDLNRAFDDHSDELTQFALLRATDGRNGGVLSEGRLEDPGRSASARGQVWSLSAFGAKSHAKDWTAPYVAIDSSMASWAPAPKNQKWVTGQAEQITNAADTDQSAPTAAPTVWFDGIRMTAAGVTIPLNGRVASWMYPVLAQSGQTLASVYGSYLNGNMPTSGGSPVQQQVVLYVGLDEGFSTGQIRQSVPGATFPFTAGLFPSNFSWRRSIDWNSSTNLEAVPAVTWEFTSNAGSPMVAGTNTWMAFTAAVRPIMHDQYGTSIPAASPFDVTSCSTDEIFADLMGTRLPLWDPATTVITPGTDGAINQFAFPDNVTVDQLLTELVGIEGGLMFWAAWESYRRQIAGVTAYRARAEWSLWPSVVKHVITMRDGCDLPTSTQEVFDSVSVRWKDATGATRTTVVTAANDLLAGAGLKRRGAVDASDNVVVDTAGATAFGARWLVDNAAPRGTGTLTVAREVLDRQTGRLLAPWELRPGCLVQIAGADPSAYSQGATARNGRNVFRVVATEFTSSTGAVTLELDSPPNSIWEQVAAANRDLVTRRRR